MKLKKWKRWSYRGILKENKMKTQKVEISYKTIVFLIGFLLLGWFLYFIRDIVLIFWVAFLLMMALNPNVRKLQSWKVPRFLAILINYIFIIGLITLAIVLLAGPLTEQSRLLLKQLSNITGKSFFSQWLITLAEDPFAKLGGVTSNVFRFTQGVFSNTIKVFSFFVINFYLILERKNFRKYFSILWNKKNARKAEMLISHVEKAMASWLWGELILMIIVGILTYLGLLLLGIRYALPLAFLAGIMEIFPNIGPSLSAIPAIIIGLSMSPLLAIGAGAVYFVVQQVENSFIVPKVMQKAVGINPIITLLSLLIGFRVAGVLGAVFSLPMVLVFKVILADLFIPRLKNWR